MTHIKTFYIAATMLVAPGLAMAAQSVSEWDCGSDGYRIGMNESVTSGAAISISIDSASRSADIDTLLELDGSYTCPPSSTLSVAIDSTSYSATID
jgi:hypothetical protein